MDTFDKLDKVDLQILRTLQENARLTTKELAARVSLSSTPVFERLKRLESGGYIKKYIAVLDAEKLNQGFVVFCSVKLRRLNRDIAAEFTRIIQDIPEVTECYNISGSYDYLLKIHAPNMKYYQEFILNVLGTIDSLGSLESTFVMAEVKHQYGIHIFPFTGAGRHATAGIPYYSAVQLPASGRQPGYGRQTAFPGSRHSSFPLG